MKRFLAALSAFLIRAVAASLRVTITDRGGVIDRPDHPPVILAFWHNRLFLMAPYYERYCAGRSSLAFISRSRDGQFISDVTARFGVRSARGSSSRHGVAAALAAVHAARDEKLDLVITPDGPRGPMYRVQPGILRLAQATGRPIVTVTTHLKWKYVLKSWDCFQVPLPFSRCQLITGEPIYVPPGATEQELAALTERVAAALQGR
jgi:lysophospholipid acyltransferase (LPLAT)-like uncharacterized protein